MTNIKTIIAHYTPTISDGEISARLEAEILLAYLLGKSRSYLYSYPEQLLSAEQERNFHGLMARRATGEPIAYLTGKKEFWSLELLVNEHTLIPRPETELMVELTLKLLAHKTEATILDLGTGCGTVAIAIASERPKWQIIASDIHEKTADVARINSRRFDLQNINVICSDWFQALPKQKFDAIISNPPYIADNDSHLANGDLRFEPKQALTSGPTGLEAITHIIQHSTDYLVTQGLLLLEHGYNQKDAVRELLTHSNFQSIKSWQDWQKNDRISAGWSL
ncbi:MAG: peptide chain release factor N(5)-glutamine methyltransferase [Legionella sp.]